MNSSLAPTDKDCVSDDDKYSRVSNAQINTNVMGIINAWKQSLIKLWKEKDGNREYEYFSCAKTKKHKRRVSYISGERGQGNETERRERALRLLQYDASTEPLCSRLIIVI